MEPINNVITLMIKKLEKDSNLQKMNISEFDFIKTLKDVKPDSLSSRQIVRIYNVYNKYCEDKK